MPNGTPKEAEMKPSPERRILLTTGVACAACCAVPVVGLLLGSTAIAGLAFVFERLALVLAVIGVAVLLLRRRSRKTSAACEIGGACDPRVARPEPTKRS